MQTNILSQGFGENKACAAVDIKNNAVRPFRIKRGKDDICPVGYKKFYQLIGMKGHNGEDWSTWHGEPGYFPVLADTTWRAVNEKDYDGGIGLDVYSNSPILFNDGKKRYVKFRFWHLQESLVSDGEMVTFAQKIMKCDSTGASSGDHLHWSMKIVDKNGRTLNVNNGYTGALDFSEYFENVFVLDKMGVQAEYITLLEKIYKASFLLNRAGYLLESEVLSKLRGIFAKL